MDTLTRVYRVRKTCLEMLTDRSYLPLPVRMHSVWLLAQSSRVEP